MNKFAMMKISRCMAPFREEVAGANFLVSTSKLFWSYVLIERCRFELISV
jgi:hypothetical protein